MKFSRNHAALFAAISLACATSSLALPTAGRSGSDALDIAERDAEFVAYQVEERDFLGNYYSYAANEARELGYNYDYAVNEARDMDAYDYAANQARELEYGYDYAVNEARGLVYDFPVHEARDLEYGLDMPRELSPEEAYIAAREELLDELFGRNSDVPPPPSASDSSDAYSNWYTQCGGDGRPRSRSCNFKPNFPQTPYSAPSASGKQHNQCGENGGPVSRSCNFNPNIPQRPHSYRAAMSNWFTKITSK